MESLTEKTLIPISLVIIILGGVVWLTSLYSLAESNLRDVRILQAKQDTYFEQMSKIREDIAKIKALLEKKL